METIEMMSAIESLVRKFDDMCGRSPTEMGAAALAELAEYKKNADVIMCAYCGHESSKADKMAIVEHTMTCEKRPEKTLLAKAFEVEDRLYERIIHLTEHPYIPEECAVCEEIANTLLLYEEKAAPVDDA